MARLGKIKIDLPRLDSWESFTLNLYSICVSERGLSVADLKALFDGCGIDDSNLFYETILILNRCYHNTKENGNARN